MKRLVAIGAMLSGLGGCEANEMQFAPSATASIHLPAIPGRPGSGYFELGSDELGGRGALISVTSPEAARIEMHEIVKSGPMTSMLKLNRVMATDGRIVFEPGERHLMLFGVRPGLAPGSEAQLDFGFDRGPPVRLRARVHRFGDARDPR